MVSTSDTDRREALLAVAVAATVLGTAVATVFYPQIEPLGTLVVGIVILFVLFVPYTPLRVPLTLTVVGVFIASVGVHGLLTESGNHVLFWILMFGGVGILFEDRYRR